MGRLRNLEEDNVALRNDLVDNQSRAHHQEHRAEGNHEVQLATTGILIRMGDEELGCLS